MRKLILLLLIVSLVPCVSAKAKKKVKHCGATSIASGDCPKEGCGRDPELNKRKNLVTTASNPETYTRHDFVTLMFPAQWSMGQKRTLLKDWGEGKVYCALTS